MQHSHSHHGAQSSAGYNYNNNNTSPVTTALTSTHDNIATHHQNQNQNQQQGQTQAQQQQLQHDAAMTMAKKLNKTILSSSEDAESLMAIARRLTDDTSKYRSQVLGLASDLAEITKNIQDLGLELLLNSNTDGTGGSHAGASAGNMHVEVVASKPLKVVADDIEFDDL
ncbi:hypothetical protein HDU76_007746 [Blyttiomyces sp. JEL0837]|nr:hypothetical protein HDU76_007746 [Blyttiomyces sp. JEL0837]